MATATTSTYTNMGVEPRIEYPKMDGENNGKPYEQMDDLGVPLFLETTILYDSIFTFSYT